MYSLTSQTTELKDLTQPGSSFSEFLRINSTKIGCLVHQVELQHVGGAAGNRRERAGGGGVRSGDAPVGRAGDLPIGGVPRGAGPAERADRGGRGRAGDRSQAVLGLPRRGGGLAAAFWREVGTVCGAKV